jgi:flavin reductase (DIM6/NTAB) family NADH-FMN oxidoreductase RutF
VIHEDHPFVRPEEERDPVRRFRGRLVAPVTVVTGGIGEAKTGLTVSSLVVADGEPATVFFLCGRNADLGDAIAASGGFVVHVLPSGDDAIADRFAGIRPSPGGLFAGLAWEAGRHGPVLTGLTDRIECSLGRVIDAGWYELVEGVVESVTLGTPLSPLLRLRGRYRTLE